MKHSQIKQKCIHPPQFFPDCSDIIYAGEHWCPRPWLVISWLYKMCYVDMNHTLSCVSRFTGSWIERYSTFYQSASRFAGNFPPCFSKQELLMRLWIYFFYFTKTPMGNSQARIAIHWTNSDNWNDIGGQFLDNIRGPPTNTFMLTETLFNPSPNPKLGMLPMLEQKVEPHGKSWNLLESSVSVTQVQRV